MNQTTRRRFLGSLGAAACASSAVRSWGAEVTQTTYTYKTVGELQIKLDVHRPAGDETLPLIVWIHGGALINGHRGGISGRVLQMAMEAGYAVASIDYRLAPETQRPDIIEDVEDAFDWLHKNSLEQFGASSDRVAVAGEVAISLVIGNNEDAVRSPRLGRHGWRPPGWVCLHVLW